MAVVERWMCGEVAVSGGSTLLDNTLVKKLISDKATKTSREIAIKFSLLYLSETNSYTGYNVLSM